VRDHPKAALALVLVLAALARAPWLARSLPYLGYTDEGHVLHHVEGLVRGESWDPGWYRYPSLTLYLIAGAFRSYDAVARVAGGHSLGSSVSGGSGYCDFVTPPELILAGRVVVLIARLAVVLLGMALARRVASEAAALVAGVALALCPALMQRSSIVIVDTVAAGFALGALVAAPQLRPEPAGRGPASGVSPGACASLRLPRLVPSSAPSRGCPPSSCGRRPC
jgi:hypothetical protein